MTTEEDYFIEDHPGYPAAEQIIGNPSGTNQSVVGSILGRGTGEGVTCESATPPRRVLEAVDEGIIDIPKMWQFTYDTTDGAYSRFNGIHILNRVYFYNDDGFPHWHNQPDGGRSYPHHYGLTVPTDPAATYWQSVYRNFNGIDNLIDLHNMDRHPVIDTSWYLRFVRRGWLVSGEINPVTPGPSVPKDSWVLFSYDWGNREHAQVFVNNSWNPEFYHQRFDPIGKNDFHPWWPEELVDDSHPPITIEPFYP